MPYWSVRLVSGAQDNGLIPHVRFVPGLRSVVLALGEDDEPDTATFELQAPDPRHARLAAEHELGEMRRRAGVAQTPSGVISVVPLANEPNSSLRFFEYAKEALQEERFDLAVAAAQIHLEVQVRLLVEMTAESSRSPLLEAMISRQSRWAPHERWLRPILEALFGVRMNECPVWTDYKQAHIARRNAVVHKGHEIDADSARESIDTVSQLWLWLNDAAAKAAASADDGAEDRPPRSPSST